MLFYRNANQILWLLDWLSDVYNTLIFNLEIFIMWISSPCNFLAMSSSCKFRFEWSNVNSTKDPLASIQPKPYFTVNNYILQHVTTLLVQKSIEIDWKIKNVGRAAEFIRPKIRSLWSWFWNWFISELLQAAVASWYNQLRYCDLSMCNGKCRI